MTLKELASSIAKREGLKKQVSIGNVREILGLVSDEVYAQYQKSDAAFTAFATQLRLNGQRRAKRKK